MILPSPQNVRKASRPTPPRAGGSTAAVLSVLTALVLAVGGGALWLVRGDSHGQVDDALVHTVDRGEFVLEVTEQGELVSAENVDIRCEVAARAGRGGVKILQIVPEGTRVKKGDFLIRLDSAELEQELIKQQIDITSKEASLAEAQNKFDAAEIALEEYQNGTYVQEQKAIENEIFKAEEKYRRAQEYLIYSKKAHGKGIISKLELDADAFAVKTAEEELAIANNKMMVLTDYTKKKEEMDLKTTIKTTEAQKRAAEAELALEKQKLTDLEDQIAKCMISAPASGIVKYANEESSRRSREENVIEEGSEVYQRQLLIQLPDASRMQVRLKVNESVIDSIKVGMPARIEVVGIRNAGLVGSVVRASQYSERASWRSGGVKEFVVEVSVDNPTSQLRTGLSAQVTIECQRISEALQIPVQGLYAHGDKHFCIVNPGQPELRELTPGITNDKFVVIEGGLQPGETISLNPRQFFDQVELPELIDKDATAAALRDRARDRVQQQPESDGRQSAQPPTDDQTADQAQPTRGGPKQGGGRRRAGTQQANSVTPTIESSQPINVVPGGASNGPTSNGANSGTSGNATPTDNVQTESAPASRDTPTAAAAQPAATEAGG